MCTATFKQYTNARFLSKVNLVKYENRCQCGFCADCIRQKKSEWALRAYYEALRCFDAGGFCLFDTLTYRDSDLKWFHDYYKLAKDEPFDFMAFSRDDIKRFLKRLRINLERSGYSVVDNLRYLITSEYGSELKTNRPHYHVLFFVNFPILPEIFSKFVSSAWIHGITDGVMPDNAIEPWYAYKSKRYVLENRVFRSSSYELNKLVNYVVKYITKDLFVYKKLYKRVFKTFCMIYPNWMQYYSQRLAFRRFKNQVLPFHLQSQGFGLYALEKISLCEILRFNSIPLPFQNKGITAFIPLNNYYKRKLFYKTCYFNGKLRWVLNENGVDWKKKQILKSIDNFASRLSSWNPDIDALALSRYHFLRRGVLVPRFMADITDDDIIDELLVNPNVYQLFKSDDLFFNYTTPIYSFTGGKFVSDCYHSEYFNLNASSWCVSPAGFLIVNPCYLSLNVPEYDDLLAKFETWLYDIGINRNKLAESKDEQTFRYKSFGWI